MKIKLLGRKSLISYPLPPKHHSITTTRNKLKMFIIQEEWVTKRKK